MAEKERPLQGCLVGKQRTLPLMGKATLIHNVTAIIPYYIMQTTYLPSSICTEIDKLNRNFL